MLICAIALRLLVWRGLLVFIVVVVFIPYAPIHGTKKDMLRSLYIMFKSYLNAPACSGNWAHRDVWEVDASGLRIGSEQWLSLALQTCSRACDIIVGPT